MNDTLMPEWMKRRQGKKEAGEARAEAAKQRDLAFSNLLQLKCPDFWRSLTEKLGIAVEFLPKLNMQGRLTPLNPGVRISVSRPGAFANQTYTDLFPTLSEIKATMPDGGAYTLPFVAASDTEIAVTVVEGHSPMNADKAAEYIMTRMIELIESRER